MKRARAWTPDPPQSDLEQRRTATLRATRRAWSEFFRLCDRRDRAAVLVKDTATRNRLDLSLVDLVGLAALDLDLAELGACRRNAPTSIWGGTKRIGRIEIVDPEPDARSHSSSQCRQTHYSDTLLDRLDRELDDLERLDDEVIEADRMVTALEGQLRTLDAELDREVGGVPQQRRR